MAGAEVSERWLLRRYRASGDRAAREQLINNLMPLLHSIVARYHHPRYEEDLAQAAALGLTKAIDRFDERRGTALRSYAIPTMHGEVRRWLRDNAWSVHVPRPLQERVLAVTDATQRLSAQTGRAPSAQQLADALDLSLEDVLEALQAARAYGATSLDAPIGDDHEDAPTLADVIGDNDERLARAEQIAELRRLAPLLNSTERDVLRLRFVDDLTQSEIAARVGCSQMQISRILRRALDRLADAADNDPAAATTTDALP